MTAIKRFIKVVKPTTQKKKDYCSLSPSPSSSPSFTCYSLEGGSTLIMWACLFLLIGATSAQTFQYSRGWTNGKRSGPPPPPPPPIQSYPEFDNNPEPFGVILDSTGGGFPSLQQQGGSSKQIVLRPGGLDFSQYLVKRTGTSNSEPLWILGMESDQFPSRRSPRVPPPSSSSASSGGGSPILD